MLKPQQLEQHLSQLTELAESDLMSAKEANSFYAQARVLFGFKPLAGFFLSTEKDIAKLDVGTGRHLIGLSLPPATSSGLANTCAFEDDCLTKCVGVGGSNRFSSASNGKAARLQLFIDNPQAALALLVGGIDKAVANHGAENVAVRLNIYSDLRWERILPNWFWTRFANVVFYDYTKHPLASRPVATIPANYKLTYSVSKRSTVWQVSNQRNAGRPVAVVIDTRGGKVKGTDKYRDLPLEADGVTIVDGDASDRRYEDPAGALVLLRRKNGLPASDPLVRNAEQLEAMLS
jgi:hypothetical protein